MLDLMKSEVQNRQSKIRWAVVGCGWVARDYVIPGIAASANGRLAALCDLNANALRAAAPENDTARRYERLLEMLAAEGEALDAVYVATPNGSHAALVAEIAAAGLPVLCEKPMARTLEEAQRMVAACRENGVPYATAFDQRFHPAHQKLRALIAEGALGTVTQVRIRYACWTPPDWTPDPAHPHDNWRADPERAGGGAFLDLAPHGLDLTQMLLGERITGAHAFLQHRRVHAYAVDDGAALIGRTESGALLSQSVAYNCPDAFPRRSLEVAGTAARALAENTMGQDPGGTLTLTRPDGSVEAVAFDAAASPFQAQVEAFAHSVLDGAPFPFSPEGDLHTMRLLEEAVATPTYAATP